MTDIEAHRAVGAILDTWRANHGDPGDAVDWSIDDSGAIDVCYWAIVVIQVRYALAGEAEGGLGALARFITGALAPEVAQPPLSARGWYVTATIERGVWCPQIGPFESPALAVVEGIRRYNPDRS